LKLIPTELHDLQLVVRTVDALLRGVVYAVLKVESIEKEFPLLSPLNGECFSLFDAVRYANDAALSRTYNCSPHFDPGLVSLSFMSTTPGLELLNCDAQFVAPPQQPNIGVLWLGEAAQRLSKSKFKAGIHQVIPSNHPRLTCWSEVCTVEQVAHLLNTPEVGEGPEETFAFKVTNIVGKTVELLVDVVGGAGAALRAKVKAGRTLEEDTGLAMSKPFYKP
jgi:hypothetical protein